MFAGWGPYVWVSANGTQAILVCANPLSHADVVLTVQLNVSAIGGRGADYGACMATVKRMHNTT